MDFVSIPNDWDLSRTRHLVSDNTSYSNSFDMISGQCKSAMHFKQEDPAYAQTCLDVALTVWDYVNSDKMPCKYGPVPFKYHEYLANMVRQCFYGSSIYYGDMLYAAIRVYQAMDDRKYLDLAARAADGLCALQLEGEVEDDLSAACFWVDNTKTEISYGLGGGHGGPIGLWHITKLYPGHKNIAIWRNAMRKIALQYVLSSKRNPWGLIASY
jgi:hypothetical protein